MAFIIQILYEALVDDFLYENLIKNHFFGVFNRMLLPAILIIAILAMTFSYLKAKKKLSFILTITALSIFLYLNLLSVIYFIGSSYNLIFLIALNIGAISLFLYAIFKKWKEKVIYGLNLVLIISWCS